MEQMADLQTDLFGSLVAARVGVVGQQHAQADGQLVGVIGGLVFDDSIVTLYRKQTIVGLLPPRHRIVQMLSDGREHQRLEYCHERD